RRRLAPLIFAGAGVPQTSSAVLRSTLTVTFTCRTAAIGTNGGATSSRAWTVSRLRSIHCYGTMTSAFLPTSRPALMRRGLLLIAASIAWMVIEGSVSVGAGLAAGSVALLGFGIDSFIELASDLVVGWRLLAEARGGCPERIARVERRASRIAGSLLL